MPGKTVWIGGGLILAIGAVAYLSYHESPAAKDAAGTIVEAQRAQTDGTNSMNPATPVGTTDGNAGTADRSSTDGGADRAGQDRAGQDRAGQDRAGQDRAGQDRAGQDRAGQDRANSN
jgi:hypothetical protein